MDVIELMIVIWLKLDKSNIQVWLSLMFELKFIEMMLNEINVDWNENKIELDLSWTSSLF